MTTTATTTVITTTTQTGLAEEKTPTTSTITTATTQQRIHYWNNNVNDSTWINRNVINVTRRLRWSIRNHMNCVFDYGTGSAPYTHIIPIGRKFCHLTVPIAWILLEMEMQSNCVKLRDNFVEHGLVFRCLPFSSGVLFLFLFLLLPLSKSFQRCLFQSCN